MFRLPVPAEAKAAFICFTEADNKEEIQHTREKVIYALFNTEKAFEIGRDKEKDIPLWYETMTDVLEPSVKCLRLEEQKKIIAMLTRAKKLTDVKGEYDHFFNKVIAYL